MNAKRLFLILSFMLKLSLIIMVKDISVIILLIASMMSFILWRSSFLLLIIFYLDLLYLQRSVLIDINPDIARVDSEKITHIFANTYITCVYLSLYIGYVLTCLINPKKCRFSSLSKNLIEYKWPSYILRSIIIFTSLIYIFDLYNVSYFVDNALLRYFLRISNSMVLPFLTMFIYSGFFVKNTFDRNLTILYAISTIFAGSRGGLAILILNIIAIFIVFDLKLSLKQLKYTLIGIILAVIIFPIATSIRMGTDTIHVIQGLIYNTELIWKLLEVISFRLSGYDEFISVIMTNSSKYSWGIMDELMSLINTITPGSVFKIDEYNNILFQFTYNFTGHEQLTENPINQHNWSFTSLLFYYFGMCGPLFALMYFAFIFTIFKIMDISKLNKIIIFNLLVVEILRSGYLFSWLTALFYLFTAYLLMELYISLSKQIISTSVSEYK